MKNPPRIDDADIRRLARTLRRIDDRFLRTAQDGLQHVWFQGDEPYFEVFLERDDEGLRWFQLTVRTRAVTWSRAKGKVSTGVTSEHEVTTAHHPTSQIIHAHEVADPVLVQMALRLLEARADLAEFDEPVELLRAATTG